MSAPKVPDVSETEQNYARVLRLQLRSLPVYMQDKSYDTAPAAIEKYLKSPAFIEAQKKSIEDSEAQKIRGGYIIRPSSKNPDPGKDGVDKLMHIDGTKSKTGTHLIFTLTYVVKNPEDIVPKFKQIQFGIGTDNKIIQIASKPVPIGKILRDKWDSLEELVKDIESQGLCPVTTQDIVNDVKPKLSEADLKKREDSKAKLEALAFSDSGNNYAMIDPSLSLEFRNRFQDRFKDEQRLAQEALLKSLSAQSAKDSPGDSKSEKEGNFGNIERMQGKINTLALLGKIKMQLKATSGFNDPYIAASSSNPGKITIELGNIKDDIKLKERFLKLLGENRIPFASHKNNIDILINEDSLELLSNGLLLQEIKNQMMAILKIDPYIAKSGSFAGKISIGTGSIPEDRKQNLLQFLQKNGISYVDHPDKTKTAVLIDEKDLQLLSSKLSGSGVESSPQRLPREEFIKGQPQSAKASPRDSQSLQGQIIDAFGFFTVIEKSARNAGKVGIGTLGAGKNLLKGRLIPFLKENGIPYTLFTDPPDKNKPDMPIDILIDEKDLPLLSDQLKERLSIADSFKLFPPNKFRKLEQKELAALDDDDEYFRCPITVTLINDPVWLPNSSRAYEKEALLDYLSRNQDKSPILDTYNIPILNPVTKEPMSFKEIQVYLDSAGKDDVLPKRIHEIRNAPGSHYAVVGSDVVPPKKAILWQAQPKEDAEKPEEPGSSPKSKPGG